MLKLPGFYNKEPRVLDFDTVMMISDIITQVTQPNDIYTQIKQRLIASYAVSSESRLRQLLKGELSEEGKPSLILNRIKTLSQGKCGKDIIKTVFLDQPPSSCRSPLALSEVKEFEKLVELAHRFVEASSQASYSVAAVLSKNSHDTLVKMIETSSTKVDAISASSRFRPAQRSNIYKNRNRSKSGNRKFNNNNNNHFNKNFRKPFANQNNNVQGNNGNDSQFCFYHGKFRDKAHNCVLPCARQVGTSSEN